MRSVQANKAAVLSNTTDCVSTLGVITSIASTNTVLSVRGERSCALMGEGGLAQLHARTQWGRELSGHLSGWCLSPVKGISMRRTKYGTLR